MIQAGCKQVDVTIGGCPTALTHGIIQYIVFPSEIHLQRPHVKYTLPGAFSHISAIDFVLIDIWLHYAIQNQ